MSEGHPDKVSDQISDAILDEFLRHDNQSKVACETLCTTGLVVVAGEVRSEAYVDVQAVARRVIQRIGYTKSDYMFDANSCGILSAIHEQSPDINQGVVRETEEEQGAGDQGIMFGYACSETKEFMPASLILAQVILKELAVIRREGKEMTYLRPDSKSQVTIEYGDDKQPKRVHTIVVSTQHAADVKLSQIREDMIEHVIRPVLDEVGISWRAATIYVNPTGRFVVGGPMGDTGLTGRKIIVDTYGGMGRHGRSRHQGQRGREARCKKESSVHGNLLPLFRLWRCNNALPGPYRSTCNRTRRFAVAGRLPALRSERPSAAHRRETRRRLRRRFSKCVLFSTKPGSQQSFEGVICGSAPEIPFAPSPQQASYLKGLHGYLIEIKMEADYSASTSPACSLPRQDAQS